MPRPTLGASALTLLVPGLIVAITTITVVAAAAIAAPSIKVEPPNIDFGTMKQQETQSTEIIITNQGDVPLQIREIEASCGCTTTQLVDPVLAPGTTTRLEITFNSKKYSGQQTNVISIHSNDPRQPLFEVMVSAFVDVPIITDPKVPQLGFARSRQGETFTKYYTFTATKAPELEIELVRHKRDLFAIEVINGYEDNPQKSALEITIPARMPVGSHRDIIRVGTNIEEMPTFDIELRCNILLDLIASKESIRYKYVKPGQELRKERVIIRPFQRGTEFSVTAAEIDIPGMEVTFKETVPRTETFVWVTGTALATNDEHVVASEGRITGTLKIYTDLKTLPVIEVPVSYMLRI